MQGSDILEGSLADSTPALAPLIQACERTEAKREPQ